VCFRIESGESCGNLTQYSLSAGFRYHSASFGAGVSCESSASARMVVREAAARGFYDWLAAPGRGLCLYPGSALFRVRPAGRQLFPQRLQRLFLRRRRRQSDNGVAIYCRALPKAIMTGLGFAEFDMQGRYIQADYGPVHRLPAGTGRWRRRRRRKQGALPRAARRAPAEGTQQASRVHHLRQLADRPRGPGRAEPRRPCRVSRFPDPERAWLEELLTPATSTPSATSAVTTTPSPGGRRGRRQGRGWRSDLQIVSEELSGVEHAAIYTGEALLQPRAADHRLRPRTLGRRPPAALRALNPRRGPRAAGSISVPIPDSARSSMPIQLRARNGAASAVPWTSMNSPSSVMTTLRSVSALESSA
jgi:exodeoxyribonuclease-3